MDFFDSVVDSIIEGGFQDKDFFESTLDDIIGDDEIINESLELTLTKGKIGGATVLYHASPLRLSQIIPRSLNAGTRLSKVRTSSFWTDDEDRALILGIWKVLTQAVDPDIREKMIFALDMRDNKVCIFPNDNGIKGYNYLKDKKIYLYAAKIPNKHIGRGQVLSTGEYSVDIPISPRLIKEYNFSAFSQFIYFLGTDDFTKKFVRNNRVWSIGVKSNPIEKFVYRKKWADYGQDTLQKVNSINDKWSDDFLAANGGARQKKESVDDIETESFGDFLDINDDIVFESASDKALKAASKQLKKSIRSHDGSIYNKGLNFLGRVKAEMKTTDLGKLSRAFESMMSDIEGKVISRLKDSEHDASELSKELSSIIEDFSSSVEKLKKDEKYSTDKLVSEVKRVNSVVISSVKKTDRFVSDFKSDSAEDIRLAVRIAQTVSSKATVAFSKVDDAVKALSTAYASQAGAAYYGGTAAGNAAAHQQFMRDADAAHQQAMRDAEMHNQIARQQQQQQMTMMNQMMGF